MRQRLGADLLFELGQPRVIVERHAAPLASAVLNPTQFRRNGIPFPTACNPNPSEASACLASLHLTSSDRNVNLPLDLTGTVVDEGGGHLASYSCLPVTRARKHVAIPVAKFEFPSRTDVTAANTGITVQSIGPSPTWVTVTYRCRTTANNGFTNYTVERPFQGYESQVFSPFNISTIPSGNLCSVLIDSTMENIVASANENSESLPNSSTMDSASFEGVWLN